MLYWMPGCTYEEGVRRGMMYCIIVYGDVPVFVFITK